MAAENTPSTNLEEKTSRWIDQNRDRIGQKILCSGIGHETVQHLSRMFPEAMIVRLTGEEADPAERNVMSIQAGIDGYDGGLFDTVIVRDGSPLAPVLPDEETAPEAPAAEADGSLPHWDRGTLYLRRASILMEYYEEKAHALCRHLRPGGTLLSLVRGDHDEFLLGYCFALAAEELAVDPSSVRQILCRENGERQILQGIAAQAGGRTEIGMLVAENLNFSLDRMNSGAEELQGREAEIMVQADAAELVRGYHIYKSGDLMGKLAVYSSVQRPDVIYYFTDVVGDGPYLRRFHSQDQQKVLRHMVGELHRQKASDKSVEWKQLELQENWEEIEI